MMKIVGFAGLLSVCMMGTNLLIAGATRYVDPTLADNQVVAIGLGFLGFVLAIYIITMLGFHV